MQDDSRQVGMVLNILQKGCRMAITTNNKKKIGLLCSVALLVGAVALAAVFAYNHYSNSYDIQLKKEISRMSESQLQDAIKECDIALERLQQTINSDETNPEERFEARRAYKSISAHREQFQKRLDSVRESRK